MPSKTATPDVPGWGEPFRQWKAQAWPYTFDGVLVLENIAGGTPADEKVIEGWIRASLGDSREKQIQSLVAQTIEEVAAAKTKNSAGDDLTGLTEGEINAKVVDAVAAKVGLNIFKRDPVTGQLFIEGRQLKSAIKEAASVAVAAGKVEKGGWGKTNKGLLSFIAEHVMVEEDRLYLSKKDPQMGQLVPVKEPDGIVQRFVHTWRGDAIQREEYVRDAVVQFTVMSDYDFTAKDWALIWLTGQQQGLGASRSQGYGRYSVVVWRPRGAEGEKRAAARPGRP